jgi:probable FeS assembly SUF system protein SufT
MNPSNNKSAVLNREVEVVHVPGGAKVNLPEGTQVIVTQALGGSYTVLVPHQAGLYRVAAQDADALGLAVEELPTDHGDAQLNEDMVWGVLKTCFDPEIPVNIVDLGLVYSLAITSPAEGEKVVEVAMTLTAPGCGMGPTIAEDARQKIVSLPGVTGAEVNLVWDPPWGPERISQEGKEKLGMV